MKNFNFFSQKPIFVMKNIISLQVSYKSSVFAMLILLKRKKFQKSNREKIMNPAILRAILFDYRYFLTTSEVDSVSPLFLYQKK